MLERQRSHCSVSASQLPVDNTFSLSKASESGFFGGSNAGGGMGPSLSDDAWIYRSSPGNIYLTIAQGRSAGMPAFGAMLPDRTIWELVAYIQSISEKPGNKFGRTTSIVPQSPAVEQVPQGRAVTATPWQATEALPPNGQKPGTPSN